MCRRSVAFVFLVHFMGTAALGLGRTGPTHHHSHRRTQWYYETIDRWEERTDDRRTLQRNTIDPKAGTGTHSSSHAHLLAVQIADRRHAALAVLHQR